MSAAHITLLGYAPGILAIKTVMAAADECLGTVAALVLFSAEGTEICLHVDSTIKWKIVCTSASRELARRWLIAEQEAVLAEAGVTPAAKVAA